MDATSLRRMTLGHRVITGGGIFSLPVPGPVDSADTLGGQGSPRSRSNPLQEKDFRATYYLGVHC